MRGVSAVLLSWALLSCALLGACAPNLSSPPARPGVVEQRGASGNLQSVQFVVIPSDATCQISGTALREGLRGSGLIAIPVKASPVEIHCRRSGYRPATRTLVSTFEEPGGLASEAISGGLFGFFKSVMIGQGQRFPPMVHIVLPPIRVAPETARTLADSRQLIESNWSLFTTGREIECNGRNGAVSTNLWSVHCDTGRFRDYLAEDLKAFDSLAKR